MTVWDTLIGSATELDLLRLGEALSIGASPRTAMGVLQTVLREGPRPSVADLVTHLHDDTIARACVAAGLGEPASPQAGRAALLDAADADTGSDWLMVEAPRRKPRLAWQGMHARAAVTSVPTQVLEVVSPGLAERRDERQGQLDGIGISTARRRASAPVNRLIWTNDNLVALRTLLDERDPTTGDWRYRGKVDLIYIDPPFMVNNDFVADNSITIEVDGDEGVSATKEPSLVEILAYKDTWREGLDSFLSMMRSRLVLLKDLLAPTGSIYVHLDWHAVHYVKVLMDEIFGYDRFQNEIVWHYSGWNKKNNSYYNKRHDTLLYYSRGAAPYFDPYRRPWTDEVEYVKARKQQVRIDPKSGRKYVLSDAGGGNRIMRYLDEALAEGAHVDDVWDIDKLNNSDQERTGYPTQKPLRLLERIITSSCPPSGLVLDCFSGSGTTAETAEILGRRWICLEASKYGIHLTRKRLIEMGSAAIRSSSSRKYETLRSDRRARPFSVESMGVYLRAEAWLDASGEAGAWRTEMVRVFGGEPVEGFRLLHGRDHRAWIHVGPLDAPVPLRQAWSIAREAADTETRRVTILSADLDTLPHPEREEIKNKTGVLVSMRIIPRAAIEQVALRLRRGVAADGALESMAVPAFYTPLSISLRATVDGPRVKLVLERCEVDVQSFLTSQRPALKPVTDKMSAAQRAKAEKERERWAARQRELESWLGNANTWQQFVDFWAVDWDYADNIGPDGKPIFDPDWQSFRTRRSKNKLDPLLLVAETRYDRPGRYQIAARVTDVFGNDGIAVVDVEVGR